jgi:hypothetical protein
MHTADDHDQANADPRPGEPEEHGVPTRDPDAMQLEPAKLLANDARAELRSRGFDDDDIDAWAKTYVEEVGPGDVASFVTWIDRRQVDRSSRDDGAPRG